MADETREFLSMSLRAVRSTDRNGEKHHHSAAKGKKIRPLVNLALLNFLLTKYWIHIAANIYDYFDIV